MRIKIGSKSVDSGSSGDYRNTVVHEIKRDAPAQKPLRVRKASAKLPRRHWQRTFLHWFEISRNRFLVPIHIGRIMHERICFSIVGFAGCLAGTVRENGLSVSVEWQGECFDLVFDLDISPRRNESGYFCGCCLPEYVVHYPTREALLVGHSFEPFLEWVNDRVARAETLSLTVVDDGNFCCADFLNANGSRVRPPSVTR